MAACSAVRCATLWVAAATVFSNDATAAEESAARPRLLPASKRKSRRVRSRSAEFEIVTRWGISVIRRCAEVKVGERSRSQRFEGKGVEMTKHTPSLGYGVASE